MEYTIHDINFEWIFDSCGEPEVDLGTNGLIVGFPIFLGAHEMESETKSLLKKYGLDFECDAVDLDVLYEATYLSLGKHGLKTHVELLDRIFNNAGKAMAYFKFKTFNYVFYGGEELIMDKCERLSPVFRNQRGLYEEINASGVRENYVFVGHDASLIVNTQDEYQEVFLKKFSELNGL